MRRMGYSLTDRFFYVVVVIEATCVPAVSAKILTPVRRPFFHVESTGDDNIVLGFQQLKFVTPKTPLHNII